MRSIVLTDADLDLFKDYCRNLDAEGLNFVYAVSVAVDGDQFKIKINEHGWSPGLGKPRP